MEEQQFALGGGDYRRPDSRTQADGGGWDLASW